MNNKLLLNKEVYTDENVNETIEAFSGLAIIRGQVISDDYSTLSFHLCRYGTERTIKEFENYLIDLTNTKQL